MDFYTVVIRQSAGYWVALCLENGLVGQGNTQENAISKLKDAIDSFQTVYEKKSGIYTAPISIEELHEFLMVEEQEQRSEIYELRKVYA
ncbi:MAG: type II toxin-antitoxin system HicB family antitoxin [Aphanothece sp. CMT-3BRIN-NPC111]|jgi:predicted RNase H-like HicB family nuclease|nr:type II toxin-antitoxin system HicB family antitoxin [Aphanothece sp. CMT-3BRIN-NPC111]